MPKYKQVPELLKIMRNPEQIRNIGIIAHIDHGKTTMTDSLLASSGLLKADLAGEARALDYMEEEQKRGITIKAANISLLHEVDGVPYVINLIDTPGHVDFSGKVTRALRAIDFAIVVVDAVEGIMAQTETVTKQALQERVRPVLYINKVDRLITELKLTPQEVQEKFMRIIRDFNELIELYAEPEFVDKWKVKVQDGTVIFGSAKHRWGFTFQILQEKGLTFGDITKAYEQNNIKALEETIPLYKAVLDCVVRKAPNPIEAQKYRIPRLWHGDLDSEVGKALLNCDANGPPVMVVTKVIVDPHAGIVATGRIFSGVFRTGQRIKIIRSNVKTNIQQVGIYMGPHRVPVDELYAGNIVALLGVSEARAGDTITLPDIDIPPFEQIKYISEPVVTVAVEPKRTQDLQKLINQMKIMEIEDPNLKVTINTETGEYLLSGMGVLHLEIAILEYLTKKGIEVVTSPPQVIYRETITGKAGPFMGKSPNKHNKLWFTIEPLEETALALLEQGKISMLQTLKHQQQILIDAGYPRDDAKRLWEINEHFNFLINNTHGVQYIQEVKELVKAGFNWAMKEGPLTGNPIRGVKVRFVDAKLHEDPIHRGPAQIMPAVKQAVFACFLSAKPTLLEPILRISVQVPAELVGAVTSVLTRKRGRVLEMKSRGNLMIVEGELPVAESFDLSQVMRAATGGRAFWATEFKCWRPVPQSMLPELIRKLREQKGLKPEPPKAEDFIVEE